MNKHKEYKDLSTKEIMDGNLLIMSTFYVESKYNPGTFHIGAYARGPLEATFHSSWNTIMEVIMRIEERGHIVEVNTSSCVLYPVMPNSFRALEHNFDIAETKMQGTYRAIVKYLESDMFKDH